MTTKVLIKNAGDYDCIMVGVLGRRERFVPLNLAEEVLLKQGEEREFTVYSGQELHIIEIKGR